MRCLLLLVVATVTPLLAADGLTPDQAFAKAEGLWEKNRVRLSAVPYYRQAAEAGHAQAAYRLGELLRDGFASARKDETKDARYWFRQAANKGLDEARFALAKELIKDSTGPAQQREGWFLLQTLADEGHHEAMFLMAHGMLQEASNRHAAWELMAKAAEAGNALAMVELSDRALLGKDGTPINKALASKWLIAAADTGNDYAMLRRGQSHLMGDSLARDLELALKWLNKSADAGNGNAMSILGCMYRDGHLVERNAKKALRLLEASHNADCIPGSVNLAHGLMNGLLGKANPHRAKLLLQRVADKGHADGFYYLAVLFHQGPEDLRDLSKAAGHYRQADFLGHQDAKVGLAEVLLESGDKHRDQARQLLVQAAQSGNPHGWYLLGRSTLSMKAEELHGMQPHELAYAQLMQAAQGGHTTAMRVLATELLLPQGDQNADAEAAMLLEQATAMGDAEAAIERGNMAQKGKGPEPGNATALQFFTQAFQMGHPRAHSKMTNLATGSTTAPAMD